MVGVGTTVALPAGSVLACDVVGGPSVNFADLPKVLESPETAIQRGDLDEDGTVPQVTGATRTEVIEVTPENDEYLSGSLARQTNLWGDAAVGEMWAVTPILRSEATDCDWGGANLGDSYYQLSTEYGYPIFISGVADDAAVDAALDELFGPSVEITEEMAEAATPGGRPDISRPGSDRWIIAVGVAVLAAVGITAIALVRRARRPSAVGQ